MQVFDWRALADHIVVGVDEVGRGALAGPVYAAAVVLNPSILTYKMVDSKSLTPHKRLFLAQHIHQQHTAFVAQASVLEIEKLNILWASILAMQRAVEGVLELMAPFEPSRVFILVDGQYTIKALPYRQQALLKGDQRAEPIAAASIVAKVARDELLCQLDKKHPGYGLARHKGYGTLRHKQALRRLGASPIHRKAFAGVL